MTMNLQVLAQHREALLLAEVAAWLHDIGKFCNLHIEAHTKGGTRKWANEHAYKAIVDDPTSQIRLSRQTSSLKKPDALNNVLNARSPKAADFLDLALKNFLANNTLTILGETYTLAELIMLGTPGFATDKNRANLLDSKPGWLAAVLGVCHNEAHVDKQDPAKGEGGQTWPDVFISDAFGFEKEKVVVDASPNSLDARLRNLQFHNGRNAILKELSYGLGDTRRPINEVLLSDWGWIVAALFKSALAGALVNNQQFAVRQWKSWKDKIIDHDLRWRILRVNFDVLGLYAKAVKIADLLGYQERIEHACRVVKQLVEVEYPLGNEVYRDTTGIYFTFPDLDLPDDLKQEIRRRVEEIEPELAPRIAVEQPQGNTPTEQLKSMLADAHNKARDELAQPFARENLNPCWQSLWKNLPDAKWELCPVCRLRPMKEGEEACTICVERRGSRVNEWLKNPMQTIWMDEIADHNDRVALLVGKFGLDDWLSGDLVQTMLVKAVENNPGACVPKNPSPARLRRVWETCERFWTETVEQTILAKHTYGKATDDAELRRIRLLLIPDKKNDWKENVPYDGTVRGKPISLLWRDKGKHFVTISNLQLAAGDAKDVSKLANRWQGQEIRVSDPDDPRRQISFVVQGAMQAMNGMGEYRPHLRLLASPDQFLALVPACDALEIAKKIRCEYQKQFGKVQNRLPLFLGLVFFPRKMPLAAVMDTARRMLAVPLVSEQWKVSEDVANGAIKFTNGVEWYVPPTMGDDKTPDIWYPYFFVKCNPSGRKYAFQRDERWLVHVNDLRAGDVAQVIPSQFAYLFLESTAQRFRFDMKTDGMLLDELPRLINMWEQIRRAPDMTDAKLRGVQALLESKRAEWGAGSEELKQLATTTLQGARLFKHNGRDVVTPDDVVAGHFSHCLKLHMKILKLRVKREGGPR